MFWFWFWLTIHLLMMAFDVVWWAIALHLAKKRAWRVLVSVFMAGQMVAFYSAMYGLDWLRHAPKVLDLAVAVWHYFALGAGLAILLPFVLVRACARMSHRRARLTEPVPDDPAPAPTGASALKRREFIGACAALAPPLFTIGLGGLSLAQLSSLRVRRFTLSIPALPRVLDGITLAHLTDLHLGGVTRERVLRQMVDTTNALRADLIVVTGDLLDYNLSELAEGIALLKAMSGRYGLYMVEGNHDLLHDGGQFEQRVKAAGVPLLLNESAVANVRGYPVQLLGLRWIDGDHRDRILAAQMRELLSFRQPHTFPIVLAHHPHAFDAAIKGGLPLTLAGHTHGGQIMLDHNHGIGPVMVRYWSGHYQRGASHLVVANGVGNWLPVRVNAPAEIVHITLRCG